VEYEECVVLQLRFPPSVSLPCVRHFLLHGAHELQSFSPGTHPPHPPPSPTPPVFLRAPQPSCSTQVFCADHDVLRVFGGIMAFVVLVVSLAVWCRREEFRESQARQARLREETEGLLAEMLAKPGVGRLDALAPAWRQALCPAEDPRMLIFFNKTEEWQSKMPEHKSGWSDEAAQTSDNAAQSMLHGDGPDDMRCAFGARLELYRQGLSLPQARAQAAALVYHVNERYQAEYQAAYSAAENACPDAGARLQAWSAGFDAEFDGKAQSTDDLVACYNEALVLKPAFDKAFAGVAERTGGMFVAAPLKKLFRTCEKISLRYENNARFCTDGLWDILRAAILCVGDAACEGR
jgi:hypothetical protein